MGRVHPSLASQSPPIFVFNRLRILPEKNLAPSAQTSAIGEQYICKREVAGEEEWTSPATSRVVERRAADLVGGEGLVEVRACPDGLFDAVAVGY